MVCETPRLRSLLVSRRGGFLEDPFFRDAWGDYNNAVRRIVDRFNHGMFAPRDRLRDSHYHSMYRTLRSARINYAAQSARFKDEGDLYKLVMDVREFVGGDLTVRTAGGTVSVRGRVETGSDNESTLSGSSRASRTLHRRFNLPPDADGERVESALSRDAVLTVTIPKRTDVRVIPVTMEGDSGSESGRSGTKRHSASHPDPGPTPRKRTQEDSGAGRERSSSRGRGAFGEDRRTEGRRDQEDQDARRSRERSRRRGSEMYPETSSSRAEKELRRKSYPDSSKKEKREYTVNIQRSGKDESNGNKRRNRDIPEEDEKPEARSRQRSSKYEEAREINIPIRVESSGDSESVFPYPASRGEKVAQNNEDTSQESSPKHEPSKLFAASKKPQSERKSFLSNDRIRVPEPSRVNGDEKENIKPSTDDLLWKYSNAYESKSQPEESQADQSPTRTTKTPKIPDSEPKKYYFGAKPMNETHEVRVVPPDEPRTSQVEGKSDAKKNEEDVKTKERKRVQDDEDTKVINRENTDDYKSFLKTKSQDGDSPSSGSKSPLIGREVKVEKKQSDMEKDMFNDCWQNFSSTLQDVLSRLQELSAELGHARALVTPSSPPTSAEVADEGSKSEEEKSTGDRSPDATSIKVPSKDSSPGESEPRTPLSVDGRRRVAGEAAAAAGVGVGSATTPPTVYASEGSPPRAGFGGAGAKCHRDYQTPVSQADKRANHAYERGREDALQMQQVSSSRAAENVAAVPCPSGGDGVCGVGGARARDNIRPASFVLGDSAQNDAVHVPMNFVQDGYSDDRRTQRNGTAAGSRPRPTSLDINHESALLRDLRKVSPVDALKDHFLKRMTPTSEFSAVDTDVHYIPVELEASKTVETSGSARGAAASQGTPAPGIPLCERRGKGIENLVIRDDTSSSEGSSRVSSEISDKSSSVSAGSSQDRDEQAGSWAAPGHAATHKTATGNSSVLNIGPDPFQQHSSSVCGGADSRAQPDGIGSGSATGGSRTKPCPRLPSESDPDVDEIISKAERVIEETRRLSADIANSHPPENDLGREENSRFKREAAKGTSKPRGFNLAPNIDTRCSPDSNFIEVDEENEDSKSKSEESEAIVEGCLSIPLPRATARPRQPRITPPPEDNVTLPDLNAAPKPARRDSLVIEAVDDVDDVTACEEVQPTIVTSPEIQSSDVMVCARESGRGGRTEAPPSPREARPRTLAHETQPTRAPRRPSSRERMGGVFSRGRTDDATRQHPPPAASGAARSKTVSPPPQTPPTPTRRTRERSFTPQEEQPPPPYVRQKAEPSRRYSGFGHVQSDNVRKMRDIWGSKQERREPSPQPPQRGIRVPASPPPSGRRAPDSPRRSSCSRSTPVRDAPLKSPTRTNNFYSSTISSRNRSSSSPRRGSASSTDGGAPLTRDASRNTSAAANSSRAPQDKYNLGGTPGGRASPVRTPRTPRRTATPPPPPPPSEPPPASPFHHKVFRRLRDASLQPDSETICFAEEEDRYKLVMDVEEYVPGEIEVLQDDKALTVKGRVETRQGSSTSTRTFCRNFHIPRNTREEDIDSALSKDGILTVYVPKKKERVIKIELTD